MKGIVFNVLQEIVTETAGEEVWDSVVERSGVGGAYTALGTYDDAELLDISTVLAADVGLELPDAFRWVGERAMPHFFERYPQLFDHAGTLSLVLALNRIIHPEVYKIYPGAEPPTFVYDIIDENSHVRMEYQSRRHMCTFAEGLVLGAAAHYREQVEVSQPECRLRGDSRCVLDVQVVEGAATP